MINRRTSIKLIAGSILGGVAAVYGAGKAVAKKATHMVTSCSLPLELTAPLGKFKADLKRASVAPCVAIILGQVGSGPMFAFERVTFSWDHNGEHIVKTGERGLAINRADRGKLPPDCDAHFVPVQQGTIVTIFKDSNGAHFHYEEGISVKYEYTDDNLRAMIKRHTDLEVRRTRQGATIKVRTTP